MFLLIIPVVYSINVNYIFNQDNIFFDVYKCNSNCDILTLVNQNSIINNISYNYQNPGLYAYASYKECYYPTIRSVDVQEIMNELTKNLYLNKKDNCKAEITSLNTINNIKIDIKSPFSKNDFNPSKITEIGRREYFTAQVKTRLYRNNIIIEEKIISLNLDENKEVIFDKKIADKAETEVIDCKCNTNIKDSKTIQQTIQIISPQPIINKTQIINTQRTSTCEAGDGCKIGCINGDRDCTCTQENGYECKQGEDCKEKILRNWYGSICCSVNCTTAVLVNNNISKSFTTINNKKETKTEQKQTKVIRIDNERQDVKIGLVVVLIILGLSYIFLKITKRKD